MSPDIYSGILCLLKSNVLSIQYENIKPNIAIGIEIGKRGWKKQAVKNKFAVLEYLFAISNGGPSHKLFASSYVKTLLAPDLLAIAL